jgi:hypothetical protein
LWRRRQEEEEEKERGGGAFRNLSKRGDSEAPEAKGGGTLPLAQTGYDLIPSKSEPSPR